MCCVLKLDALWSVLTDKERESVSFVEIKKKAAIRKKGDRQGLS